jgi:hypothetical protein
MDAFRKMRSFLMTTKGLSEDEAISLISVGVDFGVTQVVDGNWGIHAIIKKNLFADVFGQSLRAREAEARRDHVLDFRGKDAEHSQSGDDAGFAVSGPDGTKLPRTGHPDPWRARSGETLRAYPACRAWGRAT